MVGDAPLRACAPPYYTSPREEHAAVRQRVGIFNLSCWGTALLRGPEMVSFLHALVSSDVKSLPVGQGQRSTLLTPKGKLISDLWVHRLREAILLRFPPEGRAPALSRLAPMADLSDVELRDVSEESRVVGLAGPLARSTLESLVPVPPPDSVGNREATVDGMPVTVCSFECTGEEGFALTFPAGTCSGLWDRLVAAGATQVGREALHILRIEAGIPMLGIEMDGNTIPMEAGIEDAISYTKGCYVGQEVIARIRTYGHVNRRLAGLSCDGPVQTGYRLRTEGKEVGAIASACRSISLDRWIALALLPLDAARPGTSIQVEGTGTDPGIELGREFEVAGTPTKPAGARAVVTALPFVTRKPR